MSLHAEDHLVGAILLDHKCIERIDLQAHEFLNGFCGEVFKTAQELAAENIAFDVVVLANRLNEKTGLIVTGKPFRNSCACKSILSMHL